MCYDKANILLWKTNIYNSNYNHYKLVDMKQFFQIIDIVYIHSDSKRGQTLFGSRSMLDI